MEKREFINYCYPVLILVLGSALSLTALPRVRAAFNHLPIDLAIGELKSGKDINTEKLTTLVATARKSIDLYDYPGYWDDLGLLLDVQGEKTTAEEPRHFLLKQAQYSMGQSLRNSPGNSVLWFRLARLHFVLNEVSMNTVRALNLSIMTGPYEYGHLLPRLQLCLRLLSKFDEKDRFLLQSQVLIAWEKAPKLLIKQMASDDNIRNKIHFLLRDKSPDVLAAMEAEIEKTHQ